MQQRMFVLLFVVLACALARYLFALHCWIKHDLRIWWQTAQKCAVLSVSTVGEIPTRRSGFSEITVAERLGGISSPKVSVVP